MTVLGLNLNKFKPGTVTCDAFSISRVTSNAFSLHLFKFKLNALDVTRLAPAALYLTRSCTSASHITRYRNSVALNVMVPLCYFRSTTSHVTLVQRRQIYIALHVKQYSSHLTAVRVTCNAIRQILASDLTLVDPLYRTTPQNSVNISRPDTVCMSHSIRYTNIV